MGRTMSVELLLDKLAPVFERLSALDLTDGPAARATMEAAYPAGSAEAAGVRALFTRGVDEGWLCTKEAGGAKFSRLAKPSDATGGCSVDAVRLGGSGVWHRHPRGEVDLCFAADGDPRFDGHPPGWVVFPTGSDHVPTVTGGTMDILYFLPGGAMEWKRG